MFRKLSDYSINRLKFKPAAGTLVFSGLLLTFIFLRFYQLEERMPFGFDQVTNSWVMKNMIVDHKFPLEGMVAKGNSGFYIGPAYYYLLAPFYFIFRLDPIAAGVFAGVVAVLNFVVFYLVTKKIFSAEIAIFASAVYTFSAIAIGYDRVSWPVIFIPLVSVLIFYFLYKSAAGAPKNILCLALVTGFAFHVHFTAVFFLIIILLSSPLILKNRKSWIYTLLSVPVFAVWFLPNFMAGTHNGFSSIGNLNNYIGTYYIGFHLVRFFQITKDAFIQFSAVLYTDILKPLSVFFLPGFLIIFYRDNFKSNTKILTYLFVLWFLVPWTVFSVYGGEISDYYFILTRPMVFMILGYLIYRIWQVKYIAVRLLIIFSLGYWALYNVASFDRDKYSVLPKVRLLVAQDIREGRDVGFHEGDPESYLYNIEVLKNKLR